MTPLLEALNKKRDELANEYRHFNNAYKAGFNAATVILLPMIEQMRTALEEIKCYGHSDLCNAMKPIRSYYRCTFEEAEEALSKLEEFEQGLK